MEGEEDCFYTVLGLDKDATSDQVKRAYRELARKHHPDKNQGDAEAAAKFKQVGAAYETLSDAGKRRDYNQRRMFAQFQRAVHKRKGRTVRREYQASLEHLYQGRTIQLAFTRKRCCPDCEGRGGTATMACEPCKGRGQVTTRQTLGPGFSTNVTLQCHVCQGHGSVTRPGTNCERCGGRKTVDVTKMVPLVLEPGCVAGHVAVFPEIGDEVPGQVPADVAIVVREREHPTFKRKGRDLHTGKKISLFQALAGFTFQMHHLDGALLTVHCQPGRPIKPRDKHRVVGEGMPVAGGEPGERGDLYIHFAVQFPDAVPQRLLDELRLLYPDNPAGVREQADREVQLEPCEEPPDAAPRKRKLHP